MKLPKDYQVVITKLNDGSKHFVHNLYYVAKTGLWYSASTGYPLTTYETVLAWRAIDEC